MLEQSARASEPAPGAQLHGESERERSRAWIAWLAVALITLGAGVLRLYRIDHVALDPFYDAAVRSMGQSLHNFYFGAMEPGGSVSIDKPPVDLWLQVASVKLVGFSTTGLMLPEALIGTLSVPLLFAAVRRIWSTGAGLAAASVLAVLPIEVITSRSDTMDAVMMALLVLALLWIARAAQSDSTAWLLLAAGALGLAFDVKLTESFVALPGLVLFAFFALPGSYERRLVRLCAAGAVYVLVALAWLLGTLAFPASQRPFAYGSRTGSAWYAALVYNGADRIQGKPLPGQKEEPYSVNGRPRPSEYARMTQLQRERAPLQRPAPARLLDRVGPLSAQRLGFDVLAALLLGLPALALSLRDRRARMRRGGAPVRAAPTAPAGGQEPVTPSPAVQQRAGEGAGPERPPALPASAGSTPAREGSDAARERIRVAGLAGLMLWMITGTVLFSQMVHLHPRYAESITPAVAGTIGIGLAWSTELRSALRLGVLAFALVLLAVYAEQLLFGTTAVWWAMAVPALVALAALGLLARGLPRGHAWPRGAALALALASLLAIPLWASVRAIEQNISDTNRLGVVPASELDPLSSYLRAHQGSAYYEVAYDSVSKMGALVVHDVRPVLALNTANSVVVTSLARLRAQIAAGRVRYAVLSGLCGVHSSRENADCSAAARWIAAHGRDVSAAAGLPRGGLLWLLPGARTGGA